MKCELDISKNITLCNSQQYLHTCMMMKKKWHHTLLVSILFFLQATFSVCSRNDAHACSKHVITMHDATYSECADELYPDLSLNHCQPLQISGLQLVHECTNILRILRTEKVMIKKWISPIPTHFLYSCSFREQSFPF